MSLSASDEIITVNEHFDDLIYRPEYYHTYPDNLSSSVFCSWSDYKSWYVSCCVTDEPFIIKHVCPYLSIKSIFCPGKSRLKWLHNKCGSPKVKGCRVRGSTKGRSRMESGSLLTLVISYRQAETWTDINGLPPCSITHLCLCVLSFFPA